ncbi:MAG: nitronate monooxygenase [Kiritimatiellia bacterium]|jgi:nitronate monooxygenase
MKIPKPKIIQGGMGVAVSNWRLARAVSRLGQLGLVSGTGLTQVLARRLQNGDAGGEARRAIAHFPFPEMGKRVLDRLFVPGGIPSTKPYLPAEEISVKGNRWADELMIVSNFVEVFLAREGHSNPVGINYLEKIQIPHLPSLYGAILAGAAVVVMGAGIPTDIPRALDALSRHEAASYPIQVCGATGSESCRRTFDPAEFIEPGFDARPMRRPDFLPIVSSDLLATILLRQTAGSSIEGFVVERPTAGGHNAPPRGAKTFTEDGQPIYGPRDVVSLEKIRQIGLPFWLAGGFGSPEAYRYAVEQGAAGVQVGTPFALCTDSGMPTDYRLAALRKTLAGEMRVFTDPLASPTGFPFKVASIDGTLSDPAVSAARRRLCDLGYLREIYRKPDGRIGYRCPSEPVAAYVAKGGKAEDCEGRECFCNALLAAGGYPQRRPDGYVEPGIITLGDDVVNIGRFCSPDNLDYTAADVIRTILG